MKEIIKTIFIKIIKTISGLCFLGELVLFIFIAETIFQNQDLGMLILYFIACEFWLKMTGETSLIKIINSVLNKNQK